MCGRFSLTTQEDQIERLFNVEVDRQMYVPRFNGAPSQDMAVITNTERGRLNFFRWGLVPYWAKDPSIGSRMINARSETIFEKPAFRQAIRKRRCLVPSDGFFEWKKQGKTKIPYRIMREDEQPFAMAGIWEEWKDAEDRMIRTFSILTTTANELMEDIHDRMPVILEPGDYDEYLQSPAEGVSRLLKPCKPELLKTYPISSLVNSPRNDGPEILLPADPGTGSLF